MKLGKYNVKKMECPVCKRDIQYLSFEREAVEYGRYGCIYDNDEPEIFDEYTKDHDNIVFYCPECNAHLTSDQDEADAFCELKGVK